jgi:hypothetical protein
MALGLGLGLCVDVELGVDVREGVTNGAGQRLKSPTDVELEPHRPPEEELWHTCRRLVES